jgi:capsular polysaccharide biosynthesis protein
VTYRYWREILHAERLLMPTGLRAHNRIAPQFRAATAFWTARLRAAAPVPDGGHGRLYVSRTQVVAARIMANRAEIEAMAAARGYAVVHPQALPLGAQAALFAGARVIVGEYGSGLHGAVFAGAGAVTVGLRGTSAHPSFVQSGLAGALGQHAGYVLGETSLGYTEGDVGQVFAELASEAGT